jgi:hypothetical protein
VLLFCDLALLTFISVVPNPFSSTHWPVATQYHFGNFIYFFESIERSARQCVQEPEILRSRHLSPRLAILAKREDGRLASAEPPAASHPM